MFKYATINIVRVRLFYPTGLGLSPLTIHFFGGYHVRLPLVDDRTWRRHARLGLLLVEFLFSIGGSSVWPRAPGGSHRPCDGASFSGSVGVFSHWADPVCHHWHCQHCGRRGHVLHLARDLVLLWASLQFLRDARFFIMCLLFTNFYLGWSY